MPSILPQWFCIPFSGFLPSALLVSLFCLCTSLSHVMEVFVESMGVVIVLVLRFSSHPFLVRHPYSPPPPMTLNNSGPFAFSFFCNPFLAADGTRLVIESRLLVEMFPSGSSSFIDRSIWRPGAVAYCMVLGICVLHSLCSICALPSLPHPSFIRKFSRMRSGGVLFWYYCNKKKKKCNEPLV